MSADDCWMHSTALLTSANEIDHGAARARGYHHFEVGTLRITAVLDGATFLPFDQLMTGAFPDEIKRRLAESGITCPTEVPVNAYLVDTGAQRILVDAGAGMNFGIDCGKLVDHLQAAGYAPDDVDVIVLTHVHPDHVGGLVRGGDIVFRNAGLLVSKPDLDYWFDDSLEAKATDARKKIFQQSRAGVKPYLEGNRVTQIEAGEILPGVTAIAAPGHTAGHSLLRFESVGEAIVFIGDLAHSAEVQMPDPSIAIELDSDPSTAIVSRKEWFAKFACNATLVAGAHMPFPGVGRIRLKEAGFEWLPL